MARPARGGTDEVEGLDEEFLYHLGRGSDLLGKGEAEAARASLERAMELRPRDAQVLGLLGQAYYKLGRFEDAAEVYGRLVDENPIEAAARVNLGLACLKARRYPEAVKQLSIALDMNPDHKRALGYLGLAWLESGDPGKAREFFVRSGSDHLVARCDEALASAGPPPMAPVPGAEYGPEPLRAPAPVPAAARPGPAGVPGLAAYAAARLTAAGAEPFTSDGHTLTVAVRGELLCRVDGLFAARGNVRMLPAMKRFRGRSTDKPFGEAGRRMQRVSGEGTLHFSAEGRRFTALDLGSEAGYFREDVVFAFEEAVVYENGRVPSQTGADLDLVHLRGRGRFLLVTIGEPVAVEVSGGAPLRVPQDALVGWLGALTPRVAGFSELSPAGEAQEGAGPVLVELTGDGRALVDPAAGQAAHEVAR